MQLLIGRRIRFSLNAPAGHAYNHFARSQGLSGSYPLSRYQPSSKFMSPSIIPDGRLFASPVLNMSSIPQLRQRDIPSALPSSSRITTLDSMRIMSCVLHRAIAGPSILRSYPRCSLFHAPTLENKESNFFVISSIH